MEDFNILSAFLSEQNIDFECLYKEFLNENVVEGVLSENILKTMRVSVNSLRFWAKKLEKMQDSKTLIFTTYSPVMKGNISNMDFFKALNDVIDLKNVNEVYFPENLKYIGVEFKEEDHVMLVKKNFKKVEEAYVIFIDWLSEAKIYKGRFHWLPIRFNMEWITNWITRYFIIKTIHKTKVLLKNELYVNSNVVEFEGLLRVGVDLDKIPHLCDINECKTLITIKGRKPLCLNCKKIGHTKKDCDFLYCNTCKMNIHKSHDCKDFVSDMTYASIAGMQSENIASLSAIVAEGKVVIEGAGSVKEKSEEHWNIIRRSNIRTYGKSRNKNGIEYKKDNSGDAAFDAIVENIAEGAESSPNMMDSESKIDSIDTDKSKLLKRKLDGETVTSESCKMSNINKNESPVMKDDVVKLGNLFDVLSEDSNGEMLS